MFINWLQVLWKALLAWDDCNFFFVKILHVNVIWTGGGWFTRIMSHESRMCACGVIIILTGRKERINDSEVSCPFLGNSSEVQQRWRDWLINVWMIFKWWIHKNFFVEERLVWTFGGHQKGESLSRCDRGKHHLSWRWLFHQPCLPWFVCHKPKSLLRAWRCHWVWQKGCWKEASVLPQTLFPCEVRCVAWQAWRNVWGNWHDCQK